jgi:hypothetical protein
MDQGTRTGERVPGARDQGLGTLSRQQGQRTGNRTLGTIRTGSRTQGPGRETKRREWTEQIPQGPENRSKDKVKERRIM